MFVASATQLLISCGFDTDVFEARQRYSILALRAQQQEVAQLSAANAEVVSFGALLMSITSFNMIRERSLSPYAPPFEWLQLGRGAGTVIWQSVHIIVSEGRQKQHPVLMKIAELLPRFDDQHRYFDWASFQSLFSDVVAGRLGGCEEWTNEETREAYGKALAVVGNIHRATQMRASVSEISRRIEAFALLISPAFLKLLEEMRPRALVVMAHFWGTVAQCPPDMRWLGHMWTARREILAIRTALPKKWWPMMAWPCAVVGLKHVGLKNVDGSVGAGDVSAEASGSPEQS